MNYEEYGHDLITELLEFQSTVFLFLNFGEQRDAVMYMTICSFFVRRLWARHHLQWSHFLPMAA